MDQSILIGGRNTNTHLPEAVDVDNHRLHVLTDADSEITLVNSAVKLIDENDVAYGVKHIKNKIWTVTTSYLYAIAKDCLPNHMFIRQFGHSSNVPTSPITLSHIDTLMYYPSTAEILKVRSDDADDDGYLAGNGAHTVLLTGLDANYALQEDTVTLNGTTAEDTNVPFLRLLNMKVLTAGSSGHNEGTITAYGNDNTSKIMAIDTTENIAHSCTYTVPAGWTLYVTSLIVTEASNKGSGFLFYARPFGELFYATYAVDIINSSLAASLEIPMQFAEKTDLEMRVVGVLADAIVSGGIAGWLEYNE